jgi:phage terminase large subunit-like protein
MVSNESYWQREYLLKIISDEHQVIHREWLQTYSTIYETLDTYKKHGVKIANYCSIIGTDLAISQKDHADYTAAVKLIVYEIDDEYLAFVDSVVLNKKMTFPEQQEYFKEMYSVCERGINKNIIVVENNGYQESLAQALRNYDINVHSINSRLDKRSRLSFTGDLIKNGKILFPEKGADLLIDQIVNFGSERHDDIADAFSIAVNKLIEIKSKNNKIFVF